MSTIFNISEAATIAIHSMALIAKNETGLNAIQISEMTGFSKNHISKVLQQLVKNGLLSSTRGPKGGFVLKREAKEINFFEIYKYIEGDLDSETGCRIRCDDCPFKACIMGGFRLKFNNEFKKYLETMNLSMV
ncbi:MAG: Rrf2 family transcriptional regulator [Bacteroidetes bacterium]|nr:Rrf2 family transcriptional regulator [Bacteroidota bacterium]